LHVLTTCTIINILFVEKLKFVPGYLAALNWAKAAALRGF